jgi:hypothetical protein
MVCIKNRWLVGLCLGFGLCSAGLAQQPIPIGATTALTGEASIQGGYVREGYLLCQKHANEKGPVLGRRRSGPLRLAGSINLTMPPTRPPRSRRGSPVGRIIMSTSRRLRRHGSIRSSAGSLSSPESRSSEVFTPPPGDSRPISVPSSIGTTKIQGPSNGPNPPTKSWLRLNASATKQSRCYVANFRFT